ncbi:hypothetical protein ABK046_48375, partial [Streptomyces caeruleatus]
MNKKNQLVFKTSEWYINNPEGITGAFKSIYNQHFFRTNESPLIDEAYDEQWLALELDKLQESELTKQQFRGVYQKYING